MQTNDVLNALVKAMSRLSEQQEQYLSAFRENLPEEGFRMLSDHLQSLNSELSEAVEKTLELLESSKSEENSRDR